MISVSEDTHFAHSLDERVSSSCEESGSPLAPTEISTSPEIELIFLGTGTSSSIPLVHCLTAPSNINPCRTCLSTLTPEGKKNIRRNTSAIIRVGGQGNDGKKTTLLIDVGKNFQAAAVEWFPKHGLREIDAVLITHAHADGGSGWFQLTMKQQGDDYYQLDPAMNGLDDLRGWTLGGAIQKHIDVYVSQETLRGIQMAFPYLVSKEFASGGGDVPDFKWHIIEDKVPFEINGIRITPFLVQHGRLFLTGPPSTFTPLPGGRLTDEGSLPKTHPYVCFGFIVQDAIVYMSDVSLIPDDAWPVIQAGGQKPVLVIDCLRLAVHTSHMGLREATAAIRRIGARRSYLTGFNHDVSHDEYVRIGEGAIGGHEGRLSEVERKGIEIMREGLQGEVRWVRPAHDGLRVLIGEDGEVCDET